MTTDSTDQPASTAPLTRADFADELRDDGLADTYIDAEGRLYLRPRAEHDYAFSHQMFEDDLSDARVVVANEKPILIAYAPTSDLVTLPAIINDAMDAADDEAVPVESIIRSLIKLLEQLKERYDLLPDLQTIDSVAVDNSTGKIELLAPFTTGSSLDIDTLITSLREDAAKRVSSEKTSIILNCFYRALGAEGLA